MSNTNATANHSLIINKELSIATLTTIIPKEIQMKFIKKFTHTVGNIIPTVTIYLLCSPIHSYAQSPVIAGKVLGYTSGLVTAISAAGLAVGTGAASMVAYKMMGQKASFADVWHIAAGGLIAASAGAFGLYVQSS